MATIEAPATSSSTGTAVPGPGGGRRRTDRSRRLLAPTVGIVAAAAIAAADAALGDEASLAVLHVAVVAAVAWIGTRTGALAVAVVAASGTAAVGAVQVSPAAAATTAATVLVVLVITAVGLSRARDTLTGQRRAAEYDPLTGALTRHGFDAAAERARLRAARDDLYLSVAYIDLDDFKLFNDTEGRATGDDLLVRFTATVSSSVRGTDVFARVGGDRFLLLLPDTNARQALVVVERVRSILRDTCEGFEEPVTASVGIATYRNPPGSVDDLVVGADGLMYEAKANGGDAVVGQLIVGASTRWDHVETGGDALYSERETA
jgi:diguanylate cyclase (GGDEF)-like protein